MPKAYHSSENVYKKCNYPVINTQVEFLYRILVARDDVTLNIGKIDEEMKGQLQRLEEELKAKATTVNDVSGAGSKLMTEYHTLCQAWSDIFHECRSVRTFLKCLFTASKRSLGQVICFYICLSFCSQGVSVFGSVRMSASGRHTPMADTPNPWVKTRIGQTPSEDTSPTNPHQPDTPTNQTPPPPARHPPGITSNHWQTGANEVQM